MLRFIILLFPLLSYSLLAESSVWRISKGSQSFYIGGTCHALRSSDYPLPPEFELAYSLSDTLVFEIDPSVTNDPSFTFQLLKTSSYQDKRSLKTVLSKKNFSALTKKCEQNGFSIKVLNKTKPGMVVMMLMVKELAKFNATEEGVDLHFHRRALNDNKNILALETAEFQIDLVSSMGDGMENKIIALGLQDIENLQNNFNALVNTWRKGDLEAIDQYFTKNIRKYSKLHEKLIINRNKNWVNGFEAFLDTPDVEFVLVGVAHMAGEEGLISLLQKKGYTIEQISVPSF